jgi:hypothetical protein
MMERAPQYGMRTVTVIPVNIRMLTGFKTHLVREDKEDSKLFQHGTLRNLFKVKHTT